MKLKVIAMMLLSSCCFAGNGVTATATVKPHDAAGLKDRVLTLVADHYIKVKNDSPKTQSVKICYMICAQNHDCKEDNICERVSILSGGTFEKNYQSQWSVIFRRTGNFWLTASTKAEGLTYQSGQANISIS